MTFTSETVRLLFHMLPTGSQVLYAEMEEGLAKRGQKLHIDAVMQFDNVSEVIIRISADYKLNAGSGHRVSTG